MLLKEVKIADLLTGSIMVANDSERAMMRMMQFQGHHTGQPCYKVLLVFLAGASA